MLQQVGVLIELTAMTTSALNLYRTAAFVFNICSKPAEPTFHTSTVERTGDAAIWLSNGPSMRADGAITGAIKGMTSAALRLL